MPGPTGTTRPPADYRDLRALFINCTLKRSPAPSHTEVSSASVGCKGTGQHGGSWRRRRVPRRGLIAVSDHGRPR